LLTASSQALFLPSANKEQKFGSSTHVSNKGEIFLDQPVTKPIIPTGLYDLYTFTPEHDGWYRVIVDQFGENDMDIAVGYGNTPVDIPAIIEYDFNGNGYNVPHDTPVKVLAFSGTSSDAIDSFFSGGCTYQIVVIGFQGHNRGTYTLSVTHNLIIPSVPLVSTFDFTGNYQLFSFVAPSSGVFNFLLDLGIPNDADMFVSTANTELDIEGCINFDVDDGPLPDSVLAYGVNVGPENFNATLVSGSVYQVLVFMYDTENISATYTLTVSPVPLPQITNLQIIFIYTGGNPSIPGGHSRAFLTCETLNATTMSYVITTQASPNGIVTGSQYRLTSGSIAITDPTPQSITIADNSIGIYLNSSTASADGPYVMTVTATGSGGSTTSSINVPIYQ
jgi:hypothetical protein